MNLNTLMGRIDDRSVVIGVIGLGYVGLPLAATFAEAGFHVIGVDLKPERVDRVNAGHSPIEGREPGLAELVEKVIRSDHLQATTSYASLSQADVVILAVETPIDEDHVPRYEALTAALESLGQVLQEGALVIVESTLAPGTMDRLVRPLLEKSSGQRVNEGFFLGHCPERVMPGKLLHNLRNVHRVCGGLTPETSEAMIALYRTIVQADLDPADCITAELVKTAENTYRDVNIAFANELALICEAAGGDVWKVRELVNKSPGRNVLLPGAGVGGHCIPKDPWLLAYGARNTDVPVRLIPAARDVNDSMPAHIAQLTKEALLEAGKTVDSSKVLILGYAYLENSDDDRNSPSCLLVSYLKDMGIDVVVHDPYLPDFQGDIRTMAKNCDATVIMVKHREYLELSLESLLGWLSSPIIIDGRNVFTKERLEDSDAIYRLVGA